MRVFLGLGSNLGEREAHLAMARSLLELSEEVRVVGESSILETQPLGGRDQPLYLNQVLDVQTDLRPEELLKTVKRIEKDMGRETAERWESRIIDIDILFYGDKVVSVPGLEIPHPGVLERSFVLRGVLQLAPEWVHPVTGKRLDMSI